jgi:peptidoglycan/xylan/chitin deacetylase (PgdA/CDA1 family)
MATQCKALNFMLMMSRRWVKIRPRNESTCIVVLIVVPISQVLPIEFSMEANGSRQSLLSNDHSNTGNMAPKRVILNFDDTSVNQIRSVPILDKHGFKGTFFPVCGWITTQAGWDQIEALLSSGMDVQSHTMSHPNLNILSREELGTEVGQAKQCFLNHDVNTTIFAYPYGAGSHNSTVVNIAARYYDLARAATYCCPEVGPDNRFENRYDINSWVQVHITGPFDYATQSCTGDCKSYDNREIFEMFKKVVNDQSPNSASDKVEAMPIIVYHAFVPYDDIQENIIPTDTSLSLFDQEMKYLYDNGDLR